jgi:hypothetical protein
MNAMEGCSVALKIGHFAKELLASLLGDGNSATTTQNYPAWPGPTSAGLFSDGTAFFPGLPGESQTEYGTFNFFDDGLLDFTLQ